MGAAPPNKQQTEHHLPTAQHSRRGASGTTVAMIDTAYKGKTISGKHREHFYLKPMSASLFSEQYHSPFSFLFKRTPVERGTIPDERKRGGGYTTNDLQSKS